MEASEEAADVYFLGVLSWKGEVVAAEHLVALEAQLVSVALTAVFLGVEEDWDIKII